AGAVAQSCSTLPPLQSLPQYVGEEAHQDVRQDTIGFMVPDGTDRQLALLDAESGLGVGELHIGPPQRLDIPISDVGAQHVAPLAVLSPLIPLEIDRPLQAQPRGTRRVVEDFDGVACGGAGVALEQSPDLSFQPRPLQRPASAVNALTELAQRLLDA